MAMVRKPKDAPPAAKAIAAAMVPAKITPKTGISSKISVRTASGAPRNFPGSKAFTTSEGVKPEPSEEIPKICVYCDIGLECVSASRYCGIDERNVENAVATIGKKK